MRRQRGFRQQDRAEHAPSVVGVAHDFDDLRGVVRGYAEFLLRYPQGPAGTNGPDLASRLRQDIPGL